MPQTAATTLGTLAAMPEAAKLVCHDTKYLFYVEMHLYHPQAFLNLDFHCKINISDLK